MNYLVLLVLPLLLIACASEPEPLAQQALADSAWPMPVGEVQLHLRQSLAEETALDISLVVFDPGLPEAVTVQATRGLFPLIRKAEARYLPVLLRQTLMDSGAWGVIRVLPEPDPSAQLQITATILHSDGEHLLLQLEAVDASGRQWLNRSYYDRAEDADYPVAEGADPFADLYRQIANDLLAQLEALEPSALVALRHTAMLRYAAILSEEAFGGYLTRTEAGYYQLLRLPAADDPMLLRVQRIRNHEHLFIDTVDEQYLDLFETMRPTYNLWRQYGREQAQYIRDYQQRLLERDRAGRRGSFAALQQSYNALKWSKVQQQDLQELAQGFNNEVTPTVLEASGRVFRLNGSLQSQYDEWRAILRQIFSLETGQSRGQDKL